MRACLLAAAITLVALTSGCAGGTTAPRATGPSPGASSTAAGNDALEHGRMLFGQNCASCHGQAGGGSQSGPPLKGVGAMSADFWLSTGRMPLEHPGDTAKRSTPTFGRADTQALVDYVASLGQGPAVPAVQAGDPTLGRELFLSSCAACHSSNAAGGTLASGQNAPSLIGDDPTQIGEAVRLGPGTMPAFSEEQLSDTDVNALAGYVRALRKNQSHGGNRLGGLGPATEAIVGWLALVLLVGIARLLGKRTR